MPKVKQNAGLFVRNPNFIKDESSENDDFEIKSNDSDSGVSGDVLVVEKQTKKRKNKAKDGKKAKKQKSSNQQLTVQEINELKETEDLYHSNLFRMQIDETLNEVKLDVNQKEFIRKWLATFNNFLKKLPNNELSGLIKHANYPLKINQIDSNKKIEITYKPPVDTLIHGSHSLDTNIGEKSAVDVLLVIPDEILQRSDYLNQTIIHKKVLYLFYIANKLKEKGTLGGNIKFQNLKNDPLKPALVFDAEEFNISITAVPSKDFFKLNRFIPKTSNIKLKNGEELIVATPHYNFNVVYDCTLERNHAFLEKEISKYDNLKNAIKLLKIWLHQRQFDAGFYPFNGFIVSCYLIYLVKIKKIYPSMSCYQILRLFWNHFGHSKLEEQGISLCQEKDLPNQPTLRDFHDFYDVVLVDNSGYCNILSSLSVDIYKSVRVECLNAIKILDNKTVNSFQQLFLAEIPFYIQFDHFLSIKHDTQLYEGIIEKIGTPVDKINYYNARYAHLRKLVMNVLRKGLNDRVIAISPVSRNQNNELNIGIILNSEHAMNIVDKGPQSNQPEADVFRQFWGSKSEIRRFKDGSITESVLWCPAEAPVGEKRLVCQKIVTFLLKHHFNISPGKINYVANQFDVTIRTIFNELNETNEERSLAAIRAFDEVSKELRNLSNLPLEIVSVLGIDSSFRYTDVTPPLGNASFTKNGFINKELKGKFLAQKVLNGIIQLAPSGKWPDEVDAMRRMKAAFYIEIAKRMEAQNPSISIQVTQDCIEVLRNKFLFRLKIVHPKEIALAKEEISSSNSLTKLYRTNEQSIRLEFENIVLPKMTSFLHGLHHQYPSFGPTVAIAKRWLYSQLIDSHLWPDECTELIVAEIFLKGYPMSPAIQPQTGFIRFLYYLANFNPENDMIMINFNDELEDDQVTELETKFRKNRKTYPPLFIVTSFDLPHHYGIWSSRAPILNILNRVQMLAQHSMKIISENFIKLTTQMVKELFTPSLEGYNVIIHLNEKYVRKYDVVLHNFGNFKPIQYERKPAPPAGIDFVAKFLEELREAFDDVALFFYNPISGSNIALLWKPIESKSFAASHVNAHKLRNDRLCVNTDAILNDIQIIGKGLISSIEIVKC